MEFKIGDKIKRKEGERYPTTFDKWGVITKIDEEEVWTKDNNGEKDWFNKCYLNDGDLVLVGKPLKATHLIVWDETSGDPFKLCYSIKEVKAKALELMKKEEVIKDSIEIYEIKKKLEVKTSVSFKEVK